MQKGGADALMTNRRNELDILDLEDLLSDDSLQESSSSPEEDSAPAESHDSPSSAAATSDSNSDKAKPAPQHLEEGTKAPTPAAETDEENLELEFEDLNPHVSDREPAGHDAQNSESPTRRSAPKAKPAQARKSRRPADEEADDETEDEKRPFPLHLALLAAILLVIVVAVIRFLVWNKGTDLKIHIGQNKDQYIIEVNDNMVYLSDSKLEGHEDDGVTTVLCLGNEPFSQDTSDTGLAGQIASLGNCNVINAAFPNSQVTCENASYSTESLDTMDDIFNLFYVSYAISIGDFSSLETVASAHTEDDTYQQSVDALKNTDFSKVDIIAIMYDGTDYINGMAMQNPDVPDELTTYVGSLTNSFQLLQDKYPYIRIVFMSPYYAEYDGTSSRTTDLGNGTIVNYFQWAYDTCGSSSVSFLDNYYGSVNETNYSEYLSDGIHLNADGCTKVADHFVYKVIQDNYSEYNVSSMSVAQ